jgi:hypothetical protein
MNHARLLYCNPSQPPHRCAAINSTHVSLVLASQGSYRMIFIVEFPIE